MATFVTSQQKSFRGINDNGSQTTATFIAALNTNWTQAVDSNFRLRYAIAITAVSGSGWINTNTVKFQYNKNSAGWNDITSASSNIRLFTSTNVTDELATTQQISSPDTFIAGDILTSTTLTTATVGATAGTIEDEICCQIRSADVANGDTIQVRVVNSSALAVDTTTNTVTLTVLVVVAFSVVKSSMFALFI